MRLTSSLLVSALCWSARLASAFEVYTFENPESGSLPSGDRSRTLSPAEARLVLAQRAGVEDYHLDALLSPGGIDAINEFGWRESLFGQDGGRTRRCFFLVESQVEGWGDVTSTLAALQPTSHFATHTLPSNNATRSLFVDLARQRAFPDFFTTSSDAETLTQLSESIHVLAHPGASIPDSRGNVYFYYMRSDSDSEAKEFIQNSVKDVRDPSSRSDGEFSYSVTFIMMPLLAQVEEGGRGIWGSYSMPKKDSPALTAQARHMYKRQLEEPLEDSSPISTLQDDDINPNSTEPLPGILPACFSTLDSCISTTRNCTGHGSCSLLWTDRDVEEPRTKPCYACSCVPSTITTISPSGDEQTQTVHWGGPACQKRDVSTSFWLIAGITVGMVFLITFGIGSLMSVGEETLPSVIGAGVSGVGARGQSTR